MKAIVPNILSSSAKTYLKSLYRRRQKTTQVLNLTRDLNRAPASVSVMLGKLEREGWLVHRPYREIRLTEAGRVQAAELERRHELLERHLVWSLAYTPQTAYQGSEQKVSR